MVGRKDTLVLHCRNCTSAWIAGRKEFKQVPFVFWAAKQPSPPTYYLPFWRIEAGISDMQLESYADLVRRANLPRAVQEKWEKRPLRFWTPAFKIKPQKFLRLATSLTVTQPQWKSISRIASFLAHPITLPLKEAIESLTIILADIVKPRKAIAAKLPQIRITPASGLLVYLPFEESRHEFICPELQITVNKNLLTHAENL
jgi:hypothetical protein